MSVSYIFGDQSASSVSNPGIAEPFLGNGKGEVVGEVVAGHFPAFDNTPSLPPALRYLDEGANWAANLHGGRAHIAGIVAEDYPMRQLKGTEDTYTIGGVGIGDFAASLARVIKDKSESARIAQTFYSAYFMGTISLRRILEVSDTGAKCFDELVNKNMRRVAHLTKFEARTIVMGRTAASLALIGVGVLLGQDSQRRLKESMLSGRLPGSKPEIADYFQQYTPVDTTIAMVGL